MEHYLILRVIIGGREFKLPFKTYKEKETYKKRLRFNKQLMLVRDSDEDDYYN